MEKDEKLKTEKKMGEPGFVNQNCWLARTLNYPPSKRCRYCQSKFNNCLFFQYLIISMILVLLIIFASFLLEGKISNLLIVSVFLLISIYGYFFNKSTEKIIEANFSQKKAKESLEELTENLQQKVQEQTKDLKESYESEKLSKEKIDAARVEDEALLSSIGDGVIATDKEGIIMFMNKAAEDMLSLKGQDAIGKPYEKVLIIESEKGEPMSKEKNPINLVLNSGKKIATDATGYNLSTTYYYVRQDKTKFPVAVTVAPVVLGGKIIGAVDVFRDVTIEKQIDKSKSEFVSLASHQLRTPLTAIKWYSEILLRQKDGKLLPKQKKYLDEIYHGNERMIKLINIMLNISRFEAGRIKINPTNIDVKKFLEDTIKEQKFDIKRKKHKIIFECQDDLPKMSVDQDLLRMIFQNIISNAVKYTKNKGSIICKAEKKDRNILFQVQDTGIGIPQAQQKRVFEKLFRADNAFPHDPEGNGLGLYAVKMAVESLGGKIWFKSKQSEGTTFFVELPIN